MLLICLHDSRWSRGNRHPRFLKATESHFHLYEESSRHAELGRRSSRKQQSESSERFLCWRSIALRSGSTCYPTNRIATSTPIQAGMVANYNKFVQYEDGKDYFYGWDNVNHITLNQFYAWNPAVGNNCAYIFVNHWYCVSLIGLN